MKSLFTNIQKQENMLKLAHFLRNLHILQENNSIILWIKNANFSGYCFYMNTNIYERFSNLH